MLDKTPADLHDQMKDPLDRSLQADSQKGAAKRLEEAPNELRTEASEAIRVLEEGLFEATAVLALPEKYRKRLRTTNMVERLIQEVRRREKIIRIFPNRESAWRLVGALSAEKHEEWSTERRYWTVNEIYHWREKQANDTQNHGNRIKFTSRLNAVQGCFPWQHDGFRHHAFFRFPRQSEYRPVPDF